MSATGRSLLLERSRIVRKDVEARALFFSPDGRRVALRADDGVRLWDTRSGALLGGPYSGFDARFSPDGRHLLCCVRDTAWLVDASSGAEVRRLEARGAGFREDGTLLLLRETPVEPSSLARRYTVHDEIGGTVCELSVHGSSGRFATFAPHGRMLTFDGQVFDAVTGALLWRVSVDLDDRMGDALAIDFSPGGTHVLVGSSFGRALALFDAESGRLSRVVPHVHPHALALSVEGPLGASLDAAVPRIELWDPTPGPLARFLASLPADFPYEIPGRRGTPAESLLAGTQPAMRTFDCAPQTRVLALSPDAARLASSGEGIGITLWETGSGAATERLDADATLLAFSPDGTRLAAVEADGIRLRQMWPDDS